MLDKERLFDFLYGLNKELDEVRGRILGKNPLPSIREAFVEVGREESRKRVMMGLVKGPETERSVLVTKKTNQSADQKGQKHRKRPYCDYCHKKDMPETHAESFMEGQQIGNQNASRKQKEW